MGPFLPDSDTYFIVKICSRYVLLGICCASMVKYKVCRLLEHRWEAVPDDRYGFFCFERIRAMVRDVFRKDFFGPLIISLFRPILFMGKFARLEVRYAESEEKQ